MEGFRLVVGPVHVVDLKLLKVADHDPPGVLIMGKEPGIAAGLFVGTQEGPVRLLVAPVQVYAGAFLLNEHFRL